MREDVLARRQQRHSSILRPNGMSRQDDFHDDDDAEVGGLIELSEMAGREGAVKLELEPDADGVLRIEEEGFEIEETDENLWACEKRPGLSVVRCAVVLPLPPCPRPLPRPPFAPSQTSFSDTFRSFFSYFVLSSLPFPLLSFSCPPLCARPLPRFLRLLELSSLFPE